MRYWLSGAPYSGGWLPISVANGMEIVAQLTVRETVFDSDKEMDIRKTLIFKETIEADSNGKACEPIIRVVAVAVVQNPFAGRFVEDLSALFDAGGAIGEKLMGDAVAMLGGAPISYGKAAVVGVAGDLEHGGAMIHPKLGKPMRAAVGGGKALIPSNVKVCAAGTPIDLPLGHKDEAWSFDHFDTITVMVPDAPRPDEIVLCMAVADGGRPHPRVGSGPITD